MLHSYSVPSCHSRWKDEGEILIKKCYRLSFQQKVYSSIKQNQQPLFPCTYYHTKEKSKIMIKPKLLMYPMKPQMKSSRRKASFGNPLVCPAMEVVIFQLNH